MAFMIYQVTESRFVITTSAPQMWDAESEEEKRTLTGHQREVSSCVFSTDGKTILSGSYDKTLKVSILRW